jgi:DNA-binding transcriptional LysR family regulator
MKILHGFDISVFLILRARLKTRQLLLLAALDDSRNIHLAAEILHMTQPGASRLLKDIEDELDVKLFERLPRGMEPTIYGETMIRHARMALASLAFAHDDVTALKVGLTGKVAVGVVTTPAMTLLPQVIARIKQQAPLLNIAAHVETSDILLERLKNGALDFAIGCMLEDHDNADLVYEELVDEPVCAVVRPGHPLLSRKSLTLRDLVGQPWILPPHGSVLRDRFDLMFLCAGFEAPTNVIDTTALLLIVPLLQQTDSIHVTPVEVGAYYSSLNILKTLPIDLPCKMDAFGIIRRKQHVLSPGANLLLEEVRAVARNMYFQS